MFIPFLFWFTFRSLLLCFPKKTQGTYYSLVHALSAVTFCTYTYYQQIELNTLCTTNDQHILNGVSSFVAYLVNDILFEWLNGSLQIDVIFHHSVFIGVSCLNMYAHQGCEQFILLYWGELSTVFLNLKYLQVMPTLSSILFALTFMGTRIIAYGYGLLHLIQFLKHHYTDSLMLMTIILIVGYGLNCFWFRLIVKKIIATLQ